MGDGSTPSNRSVWRPIESSSVSRCLSDWWSWGPGKKRCRRNLTHFFWGSYSVNCWSLLFWVFGLFWHTPTCRHGFCHVLHDVWWFSVNHDLVSKRFQTGRRKMEERRWGLRQHVTRIPACTTESSWNSQWYRIRSGFGTFIGDLDDRLDRQTWSWTLKGLMRRMSIVNSHEFVFPSFLYSMEPCRLENVR